MLRKTTGVSLLIVGLGFASASAQQLTRGPYVQNMKPDSVEILWRTDVPVPSWVEFGQAGSEETASHQCTLPVTAHQMRLPGLEPDTRYTYRVGSAGTPWSGTATFQTFPGPAKFDFVVYGDHRNNPTAHASVIQAILKTGIPRFLLDTGDYTGHGEHATDFWDEQFFGPAQDLMKQVCNFPVIGNHEVGSRWPRIPFRYLENFSVPTDNSGTEYYYSFDCGNAHFCMIDIYSSKFDEGSKQYEWIRQDLKQSKQPWKFATMHFPVYIHRKAPTVTYGNEEIREHLVPLFRKYGVAMVFSGDSHFYQRSEVDGIHYVCSGGGGAPLYDPGEGQPYVRASYKGYHFVWVTVEGDRLTLEAYDHENRLIDSMTAAPKAPERAAAPVLNFVRRLPSANAVPKGVVIVESRDAEGHLTPAPAYVELGGMLSSSVKSKAEGLAGQGSRFSTNEEADAKVRITPPIQEKGSYLVSITVPAAGSVDAPNTLFEVAQGEAELIRGRVALSSGNAGDRWYDIGLFELAPGDSITLIEVEDEPDRFYIDAVKFTRYE